MSATEKKKSPVKVVALALQRTTDFHYLITRRGPGQTGAGEWEFPGGKMEPGETQTQSLVREILEELSIELEEAKLQFLAEHIEHYSQKSVHIFLWKMQVPESPNIVLTEHDQYKWLNKKEILSFPLSLGDRPFVAYL